MSDGTQTAAALADFMPPQPAAKRKTPGWALLLYALGGGVIGALGASAGMSLWSGLSPEFLIGVGVAAFLTFWPHVLLHEAGHTAAGVLRGMRAIAFGIGRLQWERGASGWRFRRSTGAKGISGFVALVPDGLQRGSSRLDQMLYLAGGPLANLATAALALSTLTLVQPTHSWVAALLWGTALSAALLGLLNLLPFHAGGWRSDGRGLLDLLLHRPDAALHLRIQRLIALTMAAVRPRDWPAALIPGPADDSTSPMLALNADLLRLSWAMDRDDPATAADVARVSTRRYASLPDAFRPHVATSLAAHAARMLRDRSVLAAWRPLCEGGLTDLSAYRAWLDAELAAMAGDHAAAHRAITTARGLLDRAPDPVSALLLGEYLDALQVASGASSEASVKDA